MQADNIRSDTRTKLLWKSTSTKKLCQHLHQRQFSTSRLHQFSIEIASGKNVPRRFDVVCLLGDSRLRFMKKFNIDYKTMYYQSVRRKEIVSSLINGRTVKNEKLKSQVLIPLLYIQKQHLKTALREVWLHLRSLTVLQTFRNIMHSFSCRR